MFCIFFFQLIPHELLDGYEYNPDFGNSILWNRGLQQPIEGEYHSWEGRLLFGQGTEDLIMDEEIVFDSTTVMVKAYPSGDAIRLDLVELIN